MQKFYQEENGVDGSIQCTDEIIHLISEASMYELSISGVNAK